MKRTSLVPSGDDPLSLLLASNANANANSTPSSAPAPAASTSAASLTSATPSNAVTTADAASALAVTAHPLPRSAASASPSHPQSLASPPLLSNAPAVSNDPNSAAQQLNANNHAHATNRPTHSFSALGSDPDDIIVDSARQRDILTRQERKEAQMLYDGSKKKANNEIPNTPAASAPTVNIAATSTPTPTKPAAQASVSPSPNPSAAVSPASPPTSPSKPPSSPNSAIPSFRWQSLPLRSRDWRPSHALSRECADDWSSHGSLNGEKMVMTIPDVVCFNAHDDGAGNSSSGSISGGPIHHSLFGTLFMTGYQLFLEPSQRRDRLGTAVAALPLATIERIELERNKGPSSSSGSGSNSGGAGSSSHPGASWSHLDVWSKDGRYWKLGFRHWEEAKRAYDCLDMYVFPAKEEFLFAFYYKIKTPLPEHLNGWNLYDPIAEFARQGINTLPLSPSDAKMSDGLRLSWVNENYTLCASYPRVLVVPSEKYISDVDLLVVGQFRSRGRIPTCTWKHPTRAQAIWRCSQPKVGMNSTRCVEDEKLLHALTAGVGSLASGQQQQAGGGHGHTHLFAIYDCRPRFNARANILAGKGFENPDHYRNAVKRIFFCDIHNIHVMRDSYNKLVKACHREVHDAAFLTQVNASGWLNHISQCLKATADIVKAIDQDRLSILIHCSDGWDRTTQLAALAELCLDPYYRTTKGFFILIEKEWLSYGHQFARRTGHRDRTYGDDQRSCIFLQWLDCVHQLLHLFPRHFEFNSHLLVTIAHHLYSCRFGTFLHNTDMARRKSKVTERTVSLWTYLMCSPAAMAGEFTNPCYSKYGNGSTEPPGSSVTEANGASSAASSSSSSGADPSNESTGRSSIGRGGGDGSTWSVGGVLYPCFTLKSLRLWRDYFLRWSSEQCEQVHISPMAGSVPPLGAVAPRLYSYEAMVRRDLIKTQRENQKLSSALVRASDRIHELEEELARARARVANDTVPLNAADDARPTATSALPAPAPSPTLDQQATNTTHPDTGAAQVPLQPAESASEQTTVERSRDEEASVDVEKKTDAAGNGSAVAPSQVPDVDGVDSASLTEDDENDDVEVAVAVAVADKLSDGVEEEENVDGAADESATLPNNVDPEQLAALKQRLQRDVDAAVKEPDEPAEDPRSL